MYWKPQRNFQRTCSSPLPSPPSLSVFFSLCSYSLSIGITEYVGIWSLDFAATKLRLEKSTLKALTHPLRRQRFDGDYRELSGAPNGEMETETAEPSRKVFFFHSKKRKNKNENKKQERKTERSKKIQDCHMPYDARALSGFTENPLLYCSGGVE